MKIRNRLNVIRQLAKNSFLMALLFILCFMISYLDPFSGRALSNEMRVVFSFVGVLFAILSGFFISSLWDRFTRIRTLVAYETASLENIYKFCDLVEGKLAGQSAVLIDRYIMKALDNGLVHYQENVRDEYFALYELLKTLKDTKGDIPYTRLLNIFDQFAKSRKEMLSRVKDKLGIHQWLTLSLLSFLIVLFWLFMQPVGAIGVIIGSILLFSIAIILFIVYDLSNPKWGGEIEGIKVYDINIEIYERVYDVMGLSRYYPAELLKRTKMQSGANEYRVGIISDKKTGRREISKGVL